MRSPSAPLAAGASLVAVLLVACSSGSSSSGSTTTGDGGGGGGGTVNLPADIGGSQVSCGSADDSTPTPQACIDCQVRSCKAQAQAVYGTDPKKFGGACSAFYGCICACPSSDPQCAFGCFSKADQACKDAGKALDDCVAANCRNDAGTGVCPND
jgi:hypothetical protein